MSFILSPTKYGQSSSDLQRMSQACLSAWRALFNYRFLKCKLGALLGRRWKGLRDFSLCSLLVRMKESPVWVGERIQRGSKKKKKRFREAAKELQPVTRGWPEEEYGAEEQREGNPLKPECWWVGVLSAVGEAAPPPKPTAARSWTAVKEQVQGVSRLLIQERKTPGVVWEAAGL